MAGDHEAETTNTALTALLVEAEMSNAGLARAVQTREHLKAFTLERHRPR